MNIRPMTPEDRELCLPMILEFYAGPAVDHPVPRETLERTFSDAVGDNPLLEGFVLEQDGEVAGFCYITRFYSCEVGGSVVMIEELFIKEDFRGRGLGQQFFQWLYARYPGTLRYRLEVTAQNTGAIRLYERNGFKMLSYLQMVKDL